MNVLVIELNVELGSRAAEALLAARHGISGDRMIAFRGRLEHLRRLGCPVGLQTGKGKRAIFDWQHLIQAGLALDLLELGITPEGAARIVIEHDSAIEAASASLVCACHANATAAVKGGQWPTAQSLFLDIDLHALSGLRGNEAPGPPTLGFVEGGAIAKWFSERLFTQRAVMLLDLGMLIANLANFSIAWTSANYEETAHDLIMWAEHHGKG